MGQILVVEDSTTFGTILSKELSRSGKLQVTWVKSYRECEELLKDAEQGKYSAAVLDLNLPDAPEGEVVDLVVEKGIPSIVFTGNLSPELRRNVWAKGIVDYLYKDQQHSVTYLVQCMHRLVRNIGLKVLVVDDSPSIRVFVASLLKAHGYRVIMAKDGPSALETYKADKDIRLVVMDYNMPKQTGAEVALAMRNVEGRRRRDDLVIIGMSAQDAPTTSVEFLKNGANDFITKPFQIEEFYCRVSQNVDMLNLFHDIRDMGNRDFLTGLYNRKMLFSAAQRLFTMQQAGQVHITAAILDVDFFKKVNDTYGHDGGDAVLKNFSQSIKDYFKEDAVVSRYGGEEFCILLCNYSKEKAFETFDGFRRLIENSPVVHGELKIPVTVSIGISTKKCETFELLLKAADELLYKAKESGRNQVCME